MEEMLINEEAGEVLIVTNFETAYEGIIVMGRTPCDFTINCHILKIEYHDTYYGRDTIRNSYLYYCHAPNMEDCHIMEKQSLSYSGRKYTDREKQLYSLSTDEALQGYIRKFNHHFMKNMHRGENFFTELVYVDNFYNYKFYAD